MFDGLTVSRCPVRRLKSREGVLARPSAPGRRKPELHAVLFFIFSGMEAAVTSVTKLIPVQDGAFFDPVN